MGHTTHSAARDTATAALSSSGPCCRSWGTKPKACYWVCVNHPDDHVKVTTQHVALRG